MNDWALCNAQRRGRSLAPPLRAGPLPAFERPCRTAYSDTGATGVQPSATSRADPACRQTAVAVSDSVVIHRFTGADSPHALFQAVCRHALLVTSRSINPPEQWPLLPSARVRTCPSERSFIQHVDGIFILGGGHNRPRTLVASCIISRSGSSTTTLSCTLAGDAAAPNRECHPLAQNEAVI
jgi:hypothetical protein